MIRKHFATFCALLFAGLYFMAVLAGAQPFEMVVSAFAAVEHTNIDELVIPAWALSFAVLLDALRRHKAREIEAEKVHIYQAMILSVHHVMNNFLNQMQLFKVTADETPGFDPEVLALYDQVIQDAATQLKALASIEAINRQAILDSVKPNPQAEQNS